MWRRNCFFGTMAGVSVKGFDLEVKAMFTHADKELHCADRELLHPCTTELRAYLTSETDRNESQRANAYECATTVHDTINDFWVVKNMTHLLLDLDTAKHFFDRNLEADDHFFRLGLKFARKLLYHEDCMVELDAKDELECRCPHLYGKIILLKLKNLGLWDDAYKLFDELKAFEWKGETRQLPAGRAFRWDSVMQTPQIFIPGLEAIPVWPRSRMGELPIWKVLEDNYPTILDEATKAYANKTEYVEDAYRFLFQGGNWDQILLYHGRQYTDACEKGMPRTCEILKKALPGRPQHHYPWTSNQNEQVLVLRMKVGTTVETHSGPSNNILNVHLGLKGTEGAVLRVNNETHGWEAGKVIAWDGSFDHTVHCKQCTEDRYVMMVRYMHPGITPEHYKGSRRTHFEEIPKEWIEKWADEEAAENEL